MAAPRNLAAAASPLGERLVCFFLGDQLFGTPIAQVKETVRLRPITRVFHTPEIVTGIASLRGEIVAVLDLAVLLGMQPTPLDHDTHILIVQAAGKRAGVLADRLSEVRSVDMATLAGVPPTLDPEAASYLRGVAPLGDRPLIVVDLERVFASDRLMKLQRRAV